MTDGIILIDKPAGMTSFGVVARIKRVLRERAGRKVKVGHTGTLDPFATGLMIVVVGKECKNAGLYSKLDKVYESTIHLGQTSTTGDTEGEITDVSDIVPTHEQVELALDKFKGEITQRPPIYSAIKVNGERAYKLARKGVEVVVPTRQVTVFSFDLLGYDYPAASVRVHVSSGTYIRTLAEDVGKELGVGAYCTQLRRTAISDKSVQDARPVTDFTAT